LEFFLLSHSPYIDISCDHCSFIEEINHLIHPPAMLKILAYLSLVESADYVFLAHQAGLTWRNLVTHLKKLEIAKYLEVEKTFIDKNPFHG